MPVVDYNMAEKLIYYFHKVLSKIENSVLSYIQHELQRSFCIRILDEQKQKSEFKITNILNNGFFWATPKHRRSLEKRLSRKFGFPSYNWKPLVKKTNLLMCKQCGQFYESYTICGYCYKKIKEETKIIHEAIDKSKLQSIDKELVICYKGEKELQSDDFLKNHQLVEIQKNRPSWFHQNLLESTTQKLSDSKEIKPNNLA